MNLNGKTIMLAPRTDGLPGIVLRSMALDHTGKDVTMDIAMSVDRACGLLMQLANALDLDAKVQPLNPEIKRALGLATPETVISPRKSIHVIG